MTLKLAKMKVLAVDDNRTNLHILQDFLKKLGHQVILAENGEEAVRMFQSEAPDLVLLDIMMPVMDGLTAARTIRAMYRRDAKTIPIIAMTANAFDEDRKRSREAGMNGHLAKPLNIQDIIGTIAECIQCTSS